jgi:flagellar protein FliO/FliZ
MSGSDFIGPVVAFVAILALIPAALWLLKRTPLGGQAAGAPMRLVGALPLAPNQRLVTVEVGQGDDRRWLVLGVSPAGISNLHQMPPQAELPPLGAGNGTLFAQLLQKQQKPGSSDAR